MTVKHFLLSASLVVSTLIFSIPAAVNAQDSTAFKHINKVRLSTNMGDIVIQLDSDKAPLSSENFKKNVEKGRYNGIIFHRVIKGFMIQAGGFKSGMVRVPTGAPITNEADNGLSNLTGTIAMARTSDPHSASAQFFINVADNLPLNHTAPTPSGWGYAVFGKVVEGMDVAFRISNTTTSSKSRFRDVPVRDVIIEKAELVTD